jgi:hypothetical protein
MYRLILLFLFLANTGFCGEVLEEYFLPQDHWLCAKLDEVFVSQHVLDGRACMKAAGFTILYNQPSGMKVARHPLLPGYLIKAYYNSQNTGMQWAVDRCEGAKNIRDLIRDKGLRHIVVPNKWIYLVSSPDPVIAVLVVQDMELVTPEETKQAWKNATKQQVRELYTILSHGFASCYLRGNIPRTKKDKFACVDTAFPHRQHNYQSVKKHLSSEMQVYWDKLVQSGENK